MQLAWGQDEDLFRAALTRFLDEQTPFQIRGGRDFMAAERHRAASATGKPEIIPDWARKWQATLFDHGWMIPSYPPELGGRNATPFQALLYMEELAARGIQRSVHFPGYGIVAPSLLEFGTEEQKAMAPSAIRGDTVWCIGMSEPNAGSDLASLSTRAVVDGDQFVINGQKVWTSYAMVAQKCFCYVRTATDVPKHKGISVLIVDMDTPGIDIRPLRNILGAAEFAEVFFSDVSVPATNLVGRLNDGWRITLGSLAHERGGLWVQGVANASHALDSLIALAKAKGIDRDPTVRRRLAEAYEQVQSLRALGYKGFASFAQGSSAPEHSYLKMATSELGKSLFELGMELLGPFGTVTDAERGEQGGRWARGFFLSFANTIAGGSAEIQRNIIAERILGLPRGIQSSKPR
jgi:alkylation response protein AidB-like acyl-CoA dehydrogenase